MEKGQNNVLLIALARFGLSLPDSLEQYQRNKIPVIIKTNAMVSQWLDLIKCNKKGIY